MAHHWFTAADNAHLAALPGLGADAGNAVTLAGATVAQLLVPLGENAISTDALFSNAVGGVACFSLAHRHLRACLLLMHFGYYEGVPPILRAAYEAAECGQYLSKNPDAADRWVSRTTSWPNREVRGRLGETTRGLEYGRYYGVVSALTHPTAKAAMGTILIDSDHMYAEILRAEPDEVRIEVTALCIAATAIFTCFALINANSPDAMKPQWRQGVQELAQSLTDAADVDADWSHLDEDYGAEQEQWERIMKHMRRTADLSEALDTHPKSWRRARKSSGVPSPDDE